MTNWWNLSMSIDIFKTNITQIQEEDAASQKDSAWVLSGEALCPEIKRNIIK